MIKNERQYRITRAQVERFVDALRRAEKETERVQPPRLRQAHLDALRSQLIDLESEVAQYERLRAGDFHVVEVESFDELPSALICARIAAGLSQKDLAERLGMKEQQIQRYEATDYAGASFARLSDIVKALGVSIREDVFIPTEQLSIKKFLARLESLGLDKNFVRNRLSPRDFPPEPATAGDSSTVGDIVFKTASGLRRIFGWTLAEIMGPSQPTLDLAAAWGARFKLPANVADRRLSAYSIYAHHLALLALESTPNQTPKPIPRDPIEIATSIRARYGKLTFRTALEYVWDLGIVVLPLNDGGAFHGASWRLKGRNVVVLKQQTKSEARWQFDLFHEVWHAGEEPSLEERTILEVPETDPARRNSDEERKASRFAGNVALEGRAEHLVGLIVSETGGEIPRFKVALPRIAACEGVSIDSLANYLAFRLSLQGENWWGTANNLQTPGDPWAIARDVFLLRSDFSRLNLVDRGLLARALEERSEVAA